MINGEVRQFIEDIHYEDCAVLFNGRKYFFNGCCCYINEKGNEEYRFEIYDDDNGTLIFRIQSPTAEECIDQFLSTRLFDGKTFYEVEKDMTEIDL